MLKALLFDLDGTLADTNPVHRSTWEKFLEPYGYDVTWDFYRENISGRVGQEMVLDLFPNLSREEAQEMSDAKDAWFRERAGELEALPGLRAFIEKGRETGMKMALVTNAPEENVLAVLRALDLEGIFDAVILADDVDAGKPDPVPYKAALEALDISNDEALAFEDSPSGIASSVAAGIPTVGIASTQKPEDLEEHGVELIVRDFTDPKLSAFIEDH